MNSHSFRRHFVDKHANVSAVVEVEGPGLRMLSLGQTHETQRAITAVFTRIFGTATAGQWSLRERLATFVLCRTYVMWGTSTSESVSRIEKVSFVVETVGTDLFPPERMIDEMARRILKKRARHEGDTEVWRALYAYDGVIDVVATNNVPTPCDMSKVSQLRMDGQRMLLDMDGHTYDVTHQKW